MARVVYCTKKRGKVVAERFTTMPQRIANNMALIEVDTFDGEDALICVVSDKEMLFASNNKEYLKIDSDMNVESTRQFNKFKFAIRELVGSDPYIIKDVYEIFEKVATAEINSPNDFARQMKDLTERTQIMASSFDFPWQNLPIRMLMKDDYKNNLCVQF